MPLFNATDKFYAGSTELSKMYFGSAPLWSKASLAPYTLTSPPVYSNDFSTAGLSTDWSVSGPLALLGQTLVPNNTGGSPYATWQPNLPSFDMAIKADIYRSTQRGAARLRVRCPASTSSTSIGIFAEWQFDKTTWDLYSDDGSGPVALGSAPIGNSGDSVILAVVGTDAWLTVKDKAPVRFTAPAVPQGSAVAHVGFTLSTASPKWQIGNLSVYSATA